MGKQSKKKSKTKKSTSSLLGDELCCMCEKNKIDKVNPFIPFQKPL